MNEVTCKEVIITTLERRGDGKTDPIRRIIQVWEKDGTLIAENDPSNRVFLVNGNQGTVKCFRDKMKAEAFSRNRYSIQEIEIE